jgi:hypothetical protein
METSMISKRFKTLLLIAVGACMAIAVEYVVQPVLAQSQPPCGYPTSKLPCELTGYKLFSNNRMPALLVLQIETKQGPRSFVAARTTIERFARDLLTQIEAGRGEKL